jgi:hypothetical protein
MKCDRKLTEQMSIEKIAGRGEHFAVPARAAVSSWVTIAICQRNDTASSNRQDSQAAGSIYGGNSYSRWWR